MWRGNRLGSPLSTEPDAGVDVGFEERGRITRAAVAVLRFPSLEPLEEAVARLPSRYRLPETTRAAHRLASGN